MRQRKSLIRSSLSSSNRPASGAAHGDDNNAGHGPAPFLSGPPRFAPGDPSLGQSMSRRRFACGANHPIRLFQNVGVFRLFSRKKTEHHKRRAEKRAYQRNSPIGSSVSTMKRSRHRSTPTQSESAAALEGDGFRTASRRLKNGFVDRHLDCATGGAVTRRRWLI
jgi:hypothetical protein